MTGPPACAALVRTCAVMPRLAQSSEAALPMPEDAPVMHATRPLAKHSAMRCLLMLAFLES